MPGRTREDDFLEKLAALLRANRDGDGDGDGNEPLPPAAGGEGASEPLAVEPAPPSEPLLSEVAASLPRPTP